MDVSVEQLGKCTHNDCGEILNIGDFTPHQAVEKMKCISCGRPITWESLGREPVNGGNVYYKTRWIDPHGVWVNKKPEESFFINGWWVVGGASWFDRELRLSPEAPRQYVVWCQVWKRIVIDDDGKRVGRREGYSLHKTLECLQRFVFEKKNEDKDVEITDNPYTCCVPPNQFRQITTPQEMYGMFYPIPNDLPVPYNRNIGENVIQMIVSVAA